MKRRLFLIFHGRFPGEKAASLFAAKSAEAFAESGLDVTVLVPRRSGVDSQSAYEYFGVKKNFSVVELHASQLTSLPILRKASFWLSYRSFSKSVKGYLADNAKPEDIVYSNETLPLLAASSVSSNTFYEMHDFPESKLRLFERFIKRMKWVLVHNAWKRDRVAKDFGIPVESMLCEPNAVDVASFDLKMSKDDARKKLGLPLDKKIAVYTGHLYGWKGVDTLAKAADMLGTNTLTVFVGGTPGDIAAFQSRHAGSKAILVAGHKKHSEIPLWQCAADALVLPNSGKESISLYYTSPMKLFEYMASSRPIVASDIPSIREIVSDKSALLVPPDDATALAAALTLLFADQRKGDALSAQAFKDVLDHTWAKRAARILAFIDKR